MSTTNIENNLVENTTNIFNQPMNDMSMEYFGDLGKEEIKIPENLGTEMIGGFTNPQGWASDDITRDEPASKDAKNNKKYFDSQNISNMSEILTLGHNALVENKLFYIKNSSIELTKNNKEYLKLELTDLSQDIDARVWNIIDKNLDRDIIKINNGKINVWNDTKQLIITDYELGNIDPSKVEVPFDKELIKTTIQKQISTIKDPIYKKILNHFILDNPDFWIKPAAVGHHHDYIGGLSQHSCEVACIVYDQAIRMIKFEKSKINLDVLLTGALLHDIGKTYVYDINGIKPIYNTFYGLYEHLVQGVLMIREYLIKENLYEGNEGKIALIDHIILSHHLRKEYGSPVNPQFKEAYLVHLADNASSQYNKIERLSTYPEEKNPSPILALERASIFTNNGVGEIYGGKK